MSEGEGEWLGEAAVAGAFVAALLALHAVLGAVMAGAGRLIDPRPHPQGRTRDDDTGGGR